MAARRTRTPSPKPGVLEAAYGRVDRHASPGVVYLHGGQGSVASDARLLAEWFEGRDMETGRMLFGPSDRPKSFVAELERRGYDVGTIRFSIRKKEAQE